ncbi:10527_t:CDS:2 [Cetraspora pellucida]|uniref:10527_t:CDS:1 n=1 Tax=Cetraspora pellucida TaxID=1433469 RepID=A0A9N9J0A5_9GLOM|nr:10527_t:CDS:2 [Cetraspora pellucida]
MAEARCLLILKYVSTLLNPILQYIGQMPPSDYCDMIIQAWTSAIPNMMALENANARDFDNAAKVEIIKISSKDYKQIHEFYADQGDSRWLNLFREEVLQIESKVDEISQMTSQFRRIMLDNQSKKPDDEGGYNEENNI